MLINNLDATEASLLSNNSTQPISVKYRQLNIMLAVAIGCTLSAIALVSGLVSIPFIPSGLTRNIEWVYLLAVVIAIGSGGYHFFADPKIRYAVRENDVVLHKGLFFRSITCQPVKRIQHVEIKQGPFERLFKLASLNIYSAGGAGYTFSIPGLPAAEAERLRLFIFEHKALNSDQ